MRRGSLYWTASGWRARLRLEEHGETVQRSFNLETRDKAEARARMRRLIRNKTTPGVLPMGERVSRLEERVLRLERLIDEMVHPGEQ